jgi:hypothetical protein
MTKENVKRLLKDQTCHACRHRDFEGCANGHDMKMNTCKDWEKLYYTNASAVFILPNRYEIDPKILTYMREKVDDKSRPEKVPSQ